MQKIKIKKVAKTYRCGVGYGFDGHGHKQEEVRVDQGNEGRGQLEVCSSQFFVFYCFSDAVCIVLQGQILKINCHIFIFAETKSY